MLAATDWLKLLCRQMNIQARGMTQFEKGQFGTQSPCCL